MFSSREQPPYAANFHSERPRLCNDTSSSSELENSPTVSGAMERSARDLAPMDLELLRNLILGHDPLPKSAHDILHEPRMRRPFPIHPYRYEDSNHFGEDGDFLQMLSVPCAQLTVVPLQPSTTPASRIERAPRFPNAKKDS